MGLHCVIGSGCEPAWHSKPSWLIAGSNYRMIPAPYERDSAKNIHAKLTVLSRRSRAEASLPDRAAAMIIDAANSSG
jgi:hypothetical protein